MALTRSASGPGGLSINTGSANSLFGSNTSQAPVAGGLFGNASKPATGGLFGNSTATTSVPATSGGLFGNTGSLFNSNTTTTSAPAAGGLFGSTTATSQPAQTGGLFGGTMATSQPAQSGGLFGGATSQPQQAGSIFGNTNTQQSGGLFGGQQNQTQTGSAGGLFGASNNQQQGQTTGGLFGGLNTQNKPAAQSIFGAQPQQNQQPQQQQQQSSLLGGGLQLGQPTSAQTTVPGVRIDASQLKSTTRFNDLHEDIQKEIELIDLGIQRAQSQSHDISALLPSHSDQLSHIPPNVDFLSRKLLGVESAHEGDVESLGLIQTLIEKDLHNATLSFRVVDVLNLPQQYQQPPRHFSSYNNNSSANGASTQDLVSFFSQTAEEMTSSLSTYQTRIGEIERHLRSVEAATIHQAQALSSGGEKEDELREIALILREFEAGILGVAGKVGAAKEGLQKLQLGNFEDLGRARGRVNGNGKRSGIY